MFLTKLTNTRVQVLLKDIFILVLRKKGKAKYEAVLKMSNRQIILIYP